MTGIEHYRDDDSIDQRSDVSVSPHSLVTDGGPTRQLFHCFPDPLLYYEMEQDTAVVRAVNPAFETVFDINKSAITDIPLRDQLLVGIAEPKSDLSWTLINATGETMRSDRTAGPNAEATNEAILARLAEGERVTVELRRRRDGERQYFRLADAGTSDTAAGGYIVYTTVTELRQQVKHATTRVDRLERVVNITAHDLRNPLEVAKIRLEALAAGEITATSISPERYEDFVDNELVNVYEFPQPFLTIVAYNQRANGWEELRTREVRQALSMAVDKATVTEDIFRGLAEWTHTFQPRWSTWYDGAQITSFGVGDSHDKEQARKLLADYTSSKYEYA